MKLQEIADKRGVSVPHIHRVITEELAKESAGALSLQAVLTYIDRGPGLAGLLNPPGGISPLVLIRLFQQAPICWGESWLGGLERSACFASPYRSWTCARSRDRARFGTPP